MGLQDRQITVDLLRAGQWMADEQLARVTALLEEHRRLVAACDEADAACARHVDVMRSFLDGAIGVVV